MWPLITFALLEVLWLYNTPLAEYYSAVSTLLELYYFFYRMIRVIILLALYMMTGDYQYYTFKTYFQKIYLISVFKVMVLIMIEEMAACQRTMIWREKFKLNVCNFL